MELFTLTLHSSRHFVHVNVIATFFVTRFVSCYQITQCIFGFDPTHARGHTHRIVIPSLATAIAQIAQLLRISPPFPLSISISFTCDLLSQSETEFLRYLALAASSNASVVPNDSKRTSNFTFNILPWSRKGRHQRESTSQLNSTRERRGSDPTPEPELERDRPTRSGSLQNNTHAHPNTYLSHTYPPSRSRTRSKPNKSQAGHDPSRPTTANSTRSRAVINLGSESSPPSSPPHSNDNPSSPISSSTRPRLRPHPIILPTPTSILQPSSQKQHPVQQPQQHMAMSTEHHRDHRDAKAGLRTWWQQITTTTQRPRTSAGAPTATAAAHLNPHSLPQQYHRQGPEYVQAPPGVVFGRPLKDSLKYASVQVSTADASGKLYVWGYIPVVVAKWYVVPPPSSLSLSPPPPLLVSGADGCRTCPLVHTVACF